MEKRKKQKNNENSIIAHVDMDCFYCAVERGLDPSLKGVPMAVAQYNPYGDLSTLKPNDNRKIKTNGGLIAVSYEARAAGVKRSMRGSDAVKACPELVLVQVPVAYGKADIGIYRDAGDRVVRILSKRYKCVVEKASVDEVYLDVTEEANLLFAKCIATYSSPADKSKSEKSVDAIDFCKDILSKTQVLLGGEDQKELTMNKRDLSKGHSNSTTELPSPQKAMFDETITNKDGDDKSTELNNADNVSSISTTCWTRQLENEWHLPDRRKDYLLLCGAYLIQQLRKDLFEETGYTSSAGIAHSKILSKVASAMHKPNKMTVIPSSVVKTLMKSMPLNRLRGFGGKLGEELREHFQIETAGDLLAVGEQRLLTKYPDTSHTQNVSWMLAMARGEVYEPVKPVVASQIISSGKQFRGKMALSASSLGDGKALSWINEMSKELVARVEDMSVKHDLHPSSVGIHVSIHLSPGSSSSVSISKNCTIPPHVKSHGGKLNASAFALHALSLITSAIEKSPKVPSTTAEVATPTWCITAIFLNATNFTKRASDKQSISSFFKSSSPKKETGVNNTNNCSTSAHDTNSSTLCDNNEQDEVSQPVLKKRKELNKYFVQSAGQDEGYDKYVNSDKRENKSRRLSVDTPQDGSLSSTGVKKMFPEDCPIPFQSSGPLEGIDVVDRNPCASSCDVTDNETGCSSIDMEVYRHLPPEIQKEVAATYKLHHGESSSKVSSGAKSFMSKCSTVKVTRGVSVDSIISQRMKAKEQKQRESSGIHLYFKKK